MSKYYYTIMRLEHSAYYKTIKGVQYRPMLFLNFLFAAKFLVRD